MDATAKTPLFTALLVLASLLTPVSGAMADNTPMGDGMMGNGSMYGSMYGYNWMWLTALIVVVLGFVLVAVLRKTK